MPLLSTTKWLPKEFSVAINILTSYSTNYHIHVNNQMTKKTPRKSKESTNIEHPQEKEMENINSSRSLSKLGQT